MTLQKVIKSNYSNADELIELVQKYELEKFLDHTLTNVGKAINRSDQNKLNQTSGIVLVRVNDVLLNINEEEKIALQYLLGDIFQSLYDSIKDDNIKKEIQANLYSTCKDYGYDKNSLAQYMGFEKNQILKKLPNNTKLPYYEWLGNDYELNLLADRLKVREIISKVKEFKNLFRPVISPITFEANSNKINDLVVLFYILKSKNLIKPRILSGHYSPLVKYGMDNDGSYLFKKAPNKIHEYLKRDKVLYQRLLSKYEKIVRNLASKTLESMSGQ